MTMIRCKPARPVAGTRTTVSHGHNRDSTAHRGGPTVGRRGFLRGLAAGAAALPVLGRGELGAQDASPPQRLVLFPSLNGVRGDVFWPGDDGGLRLVSEPLAAIRDRVTFVRGLSIDGSYNHFAVRSMFTGAPITDYSNPEPTLASVDHLIAHALEQRHGATSVRSLHLGARPAPYLGAAFAGRQHIFRSPVEAVAVQANPVAAFDGLLSPADAAGGGALAGDGSAHAAAVRALLLAELQSLRGRAAGVPRALEKLDLHQRSLLETVTGGPLPPVVATADCGTTLPSIEALRPQLQGNDAAAYGDDLLGPIIDAQVDLIARAVSCGATRVATLQTSWADGDVLMPLPDGSRLPWHPTSHENADAYAQLQRAYVQRFVRLVQLLDVPDPLDPSGNSRVIDNTCVLWMSECEPNHNADSVSCFYAGGAGGRLVTGDYVRADGASNKQLMASLCDAFGVTRDASRQFGAEGLSEVLV